MIARIEPRSTRPDLTGKIPTRSGPKIPTPSESVAQHPLRPLAPFLGQATTCPEEARGISHSPSALLLPADHSYPPSKLHISRGAEIPTGSGLPTIPLSPLDATLMHLPASVANKRLTAYLNSLDATLTKNRGKGLAGQFPKSKNCPILRNFS
jgi:hypothetical protein